MRGSRQEPLFSYREPPIEFCEVASTGMELLGARFLREFYDEGDSRRSYGNFLEEIVLLVPWIATIDAFQHWIYTHEGHRRDERTKVWLGLRERFGGVEDWSGYEDGHSYMWQRQPHLFLHPFYYVEYGKSPSSEPLQVLFESAGIRFGFGRKTTETLITAVVEELRSMRPS